MEWKGMETHPILASLYSQHGGDRGGHRGRRGGRARHRAAHDLPQLALRAGARLAPLEDRLQGHPDTGLAGRLDEPGQGDAGTTRHRLPERLDSSLCFSFRDRMTAKHAPALENESGVAQLQSGDGFPLLGHLLHDRRVPGAHLRHQERQQEIDRHDAQHEEGAQMGNASAVISTIGH